MILHILTESPGTDTFRQCFASISQGDGLLLIQNGVYMNTEHQMFSPVAKIFALAADRQARGLTDLSPEINLIDYAEFVELTLKYDKTVTW
ncbi:sulfurtransferase complex subunit TusB [Lacimicrobium alkaliphilum]|uniref:Sulfur relay protein DsrH n=1 Tax=Lacimicrobium alkaliphilum TaxID=1526571 RepID=A0ABQ1RUR9_9ALTE|nr:sulfurtransferase complex subunit TusB [Lacimicrobium alkaliphilum]GGD78102.1 hypothetical protein GCM10011357_36500 [Lacimicrobium alkaliphilum]